MARELLIENCGYYKFDVVPKSLNEAAFVAGSTEKSPVLLEVVGPMTVIGVKNANGRVYPYEEIDQAIKNLRAQLDALCVFGELDHPGQDRNGETSLKLVSHIIKDLWIEKKVMTIVVDGKEVTGEFDVMMGRWLIPDNTYGRELSVLFEIGCAVGTSMRGWGELDSSNTVRNYILKTVDAVDDPSAGTRFGQVRESVTEGSSDGSDLVILNDQGAERVLSYLGRSLKNLGEDSNLDDASRMEFLDSMALTLESLSVGEVHQDSLKSLKGEIEVMRTQNKTRRMIESATSSRRSVSEGGDEVTTPGTGAEVPALDTSTLTDVEDDDNEAGLIGESGDDDEFSDDESDESDNELDESEDEGMQYDDTSSDELVGESKKNLLRRYMIAESAIVDLRKYALTSESVIKELRDYAICLEGTIDSMREYALKLESALNEMRDLNLTYHEGLDVTRNYALSLESVVEDLRTHIKNDAALNESTSKALLETLQAKLDAQSTELENLKSRNKSLKEAISNEVSAAIRITPQLELFREELSESISKSMLESRIQKYVRIIEATNRVRIDLPISAPLNESANRPKSTATSLFGIHQGLR